MHGGKSLKKTPSAHAQRLDRSRRKPIKPARPKFDTGDDPATFAAALDLQMRRHGESAERLWRAIVHDEDNLDPATITNWRTGSSAPRSLNSLRYLGRIEERYGLVPGYFQAKFPHRARAITLTFALENGQWRLVFDQNTAIPTPIAQ